MCCWCCCRCCCRLFLSSAAAAAAADVHTDGSYNQTTKCLCCNFASFFSPTYFPAVFREKEEEDDNDEKKKTNCLAQTNTFVALRKKKNSEQWKKGTLHGGDETCRFELMLCCSQNRYRCRYYCHTSCERAHLCSFALYFGLLSCSNFSPLFIGTVEFPLRCHSLLLNYFTRRERERFRFLVFVPFTTDFDTVHHSVVDGTMESFFKFFPLKPSRLHESHSNRLIFITFQSICGMHSR